MEIQYKTDWMIDMTSMAHIQSSLNRKFVQAIIDVKDADLGYIGDLLLESEDPQNLQIIQKLIEENSIEIHKSNSTITIPSTNCVDCIRLEPYYLVKDLKKLYK